LVLGGGGMLGHKMVQILGERFEDTWCTLFESAGDPVLARVPWLWGERVIDGLDVLDRPALSTRLADLRPDVIVNCIGIIKQRPEANDAILSIELNSLLPHRLAVLAADWGGRVIHFSTDCVFSGRDGGYTEESPSDAQDLYGKSKFLGEVTAPNALTLRTSIIGHELKNHASLLDWFLSQDGGSIRGYRGVLYSGVSTNHLARTVAALIADHADVTGLYQIASDPISKYDLLRLVRDAYGLDVAIEPVDEPVNDRSLDGQRFQRATGLATPPWSEMIAELAAEYPTYQTWRQTR
jgi:dTDP-4-dehydrorhamnose reductase